MSRVLVVYFALGRILKGMNIEILASFCLKFHPDAHYFHFSENK